MKFEWDGTKAAANLARHGVSFEEAATVFRDLLSQTGRDPDHSDDEERFVIFGVSTRGRLLLMATPNAAIQSASSARVPQHRANDGSMKKANRKPADDLRPEYKRSDLGTLVRGKYAQRAAEASNVVVLEPKVAEAFPNDRAVNKALRGLLRTRKRTARASPRGTRTRRERRAG